MKKTILGYCAAVFMSAALYMGCNDTVSGKDCMASCQDVDNTCVKKCTDDQCKMQCQTDLDNCSISCENVTVSPPGTGGTNATGGTPGTGGVTGTGGTK